MTGWRRRAGPGPRYAVGVAPSTGSRGVTPSAVHSRSAALALLAVLSLVWGVHWVVAKIGLQYIPPLTYGTLRIAAGLLTLVVILAAQRSLRRPPRSDLPIILSVGLGQIAASIVLMLLALQFIAAGRSSVLMYTMPLWVALIMWLLFRTPPRRNEAVGLALGIAGVLTLVNPTVIDWTIPGEVFGNLALILAAILWAGVTIHIRRHTWASRPLDLQPWMLLVALVPVGIAAALFESGREITWGLPAVLALLYSGPLATAFAYWASQSITRSLGPLASAVGFLATPVVGLIAGAVILGEALGPLDIVGFGLVFAGIAATSLVQSPAPPLSPAAGPSTEAEQEPAR